MAVKFRFIEVLRSLKGQLLLAFFSWSLCNHSWGQVSAFVDADQKGSSGLAVPKHWLSAGLAQPGSDEWVHYRVDAGLAYTRSPWSFSIAQTKQGYLYSSSNALFLAAENDSKKSIDLTTQGHFPLHAELWTLKATTFAASFNQALSDDLTVLVKPYVLKIQDYQHTQAQFKLINQGNESQIIGRLHRTGTRNYGFLIDEQPDYGWGAGLDLRTDWKSPWGSAQLKVDNLFNRLVFRTVHHSQRQYNVTATGGKLNIAEQPSVSGEYGHARRQESLPVTWFMNFQPMDIKGLTTGITGQGTQARWTAGYAQRFTFGRIWLRTVAAHNWSVGTDWNFHPHWRAGIGITTDKNLNAPTVSNFHLIGSW